MREIRHQLHSITTWYILSSSSFRPLFFFAFYISFSDEISRSMLESGASIFYSRRTMIILQSLTSHFFRLWYKKRFFWNHSFGGKRVFFFKTSSIFFFKIRTRFQNFSLWFLFPIVLPVVRIFRFVFDRRFEFVLSFVFDRKFKFFFRSLNFPSEFRIFNFSASGKK